MYSINSVYKRETESKYKGKELLKNKTTKMKKEKKQLKKTHYQ